jgi:hypothetical protein
MILDQVISYLELVRTNCGVFTVIARRILYSLYKLQHDKQTHRYIFVNTKFFVPCNSCNVAKSIQQFRWQHRTNMG